MSQPAIIDTGMVLEAASHIKEAFLWSTTPQGNEYWDKVVQNLEDLVHGNERCPHCQQLL